MPSEFSVLFAALPTELSNLVQAELAAGNSIIEIGHSHPAPPVGAYVKLAKKISTRPRASGGGLSFYERNSSLYSGEFTDAKRFYFVLEPPLPPPPEPDMDAIRAAIEARQRAADAERCPDRTVIDYRSGLAERAAVPPRPTAAATSASSAVERFRESMAMNYERWHDGIGYDLEILKTATPEELAPYFDAEWLYRQGADHGANGIMVFLILTRTS